MSDVMSMHTKAVEAAIEAAGASLTATDGPLLQLCRTLALQMDAAGLEGPGTRLAGTYLTAVRTLMARTASIRPEAANGKLAQLRRDHVIQRAKRTA